MNSREKVSVLCSQCGRRLPRRDFSVHLQSCESHQIPIPKASVALWSKARAKIRTALKDIRRHRAYLPKKGAQGKFCKKHIGWGSIEQLLKNPPALAKGILKGNGRVWMSFGLGGVRVPSSRMNVNAALFEHKFVVFDESSVYLAQLDSTSEIDSGNWTSQASDWFQKPCERCGSSVVKIGKLAYLFGGKQRVKTQAWSRQEPLLNDLWTFSPWTWSWEKLKPREVYKPSPRRGHAACCISSERGDEMMVFGGVVQDGVLANDLFIYNPKDCEWRTFLHIGLLPSPRVGHTLTFVPGLKCTVLFGGVVKAGARDEGDVYTFSLSEQVWSKPEVSGAPPGRTGHSAVLCPTRADQIYFFGGKLLQGGTIEGCLRILHCGEEFVWTQPATYGHKPGKRFGHVAVASSTHMLVFGGCHGSSYCDADISVMTCPDAPPPKPASPPPVEAPIAVKHFTFARIGGGSNTLPQREGPLVHTRTTYQHLSPAINGRQRKAMPRRPETAVTAPRRRPPVGHGKADRRPQRRRPMTALPQRRGAVAKKKPPAVVDDDDVEPIPSPAESRTDLRMRLVGLDNFTPVLRNRKKF